MTLFAIGLGIRSGLAAGFIERFGVPGTLMAAAALMTVAAICCLGVPEVRNEGHNAS